MTTVGAFLTRDRLLVVFFAVRFFLLGDFLAGAFFSTFGPDLERDLSPTDELFFFLATICSSQIPR